MALNTNPFIEGINPTATFGGYASVLLQLVRQAIPSSTYGMILFDNTAPDVTGSNAWRKTCVWLNLTNPNIPTVNVYKEGTSPGWVNTNVIIADNSISTSMIKNYDPATLNTGVTLPKLSPAGGAALQLIRVNATNTAFEFVSLASLVTVGSILPAAISGVAVAPGTTRFLGNYNAGTTTWFTAGAIVDEIVQGTIPADLLGVPGALSARSKFITARTADTFATYRYFEPNVDILSGAMNGNRITDNTLPISKIIPGAEGSLLSVVGGTPDWVPYPTIPVAPMTREFAFITGTQTLTTLGESQIFVGTALTQPTVNAQWNAAAGSYTVLNTGYFKITACINSESDSVALSTHLSIILRKNGVIVNQTHLLEIDENGLAASKNFPIVLTHIAKVSVANTDVFTLHGFNNNATDVRILQYSSLTIERIDTI
jgi:hypothetical protein